jgi:CRISPR-associated protein Cmr1
MLSLSVHAIAPSIMQTRTLTLQFLTPAFLGNAEQSGAWRTPPIKALFRQWWRVAYAASKNFDVDVGAMRHEEGLLFGHAWLENDRDEKGNKVAARKGEVRLRLDRWDSGTLVDWNANMPKISHPEVTNRNTGKLQPIGSDLYLGFGPLEYRNNRTNLKKNAAIQAGESATLQLAFPDEHAPLLDQALWLMDRFGTLGGRSRNGWGSFSLTPQEAKLSGNLPLCDWQKCLRLDWPHAIGQNEQGALIWKTAPQRDWKAVIVELAKLKIGLRTRFAFTTGKNAPRTEARHWLSYPVTNHSVAAWGNNLRLPNSLRFKVRPTANGQLEGVIFHVPCRPPAVFYHGNNQITQVWQDVHAFLNDQRQTLSRAQE